MIFKDGYPYVISLHSFLMKSLPTLLYTHAIFSIFILPAYWFLSHCTKLLCSIQNAAMCPQVTFIKKQAYFSYPQVHPHTSTLPGT